MRPSVLGVSFLALVCGCGGVVGGNNGTTGAGGASATSGAGGASTTTGAGGASATTGAGGASTTTGAGGASTTTGAGGMTTTTGAGGTTTGGGWPAADPSMMGPFTTTTSNNVDGNMLYSIFRPATLQGRHPLITWGNGTGATPQSYSRLLTLYASHGFIVIASNNPNVGMVTPPPMLEAITWVLAQDALASSPLYQHVDAAHIGATGHSQGAFATTTAGSDARIVTIAPIEGAQQNRNLHGPALLLCGGMDTTVMCSGVQNAYNAIGNVPVMYAEQIAATHTNWVFTAGGGTNPFYTISNAWFRVHLMGDEALRPMFYGNCSICQDTATWVTMRKMLN